MRKSRENYPEKHTGRLLILATATLMIASLAYAETPAVPPSGCYVTALTDLGLVRGKLSDDGGWWNVPTCLLKTLLASVPLPMAACIQ